MKFEYTGNGGESIFLPTRIKLDKKGQIIDVADEELVKVLESRPDRFRLLKESKKVKGADV